MWKCYKPEKSIQLEGFFSVFEATYDSKFCFHGETHDFWEIVFVREGNVCISTGECVFHLSKGEMIFHRPMELHKFHIENGKSATLFIMSFSASGTGMKKFENCVLRLLPDQNQAVSYMISFLRNECALPDRFDFSCLNELAKHPAKFQSFTCMVELLLLSFLKESNYINAISDTPETIAYQNAVRFMEKQIGEWLSVSEIAKECHVSVSYLKKVFAKYSGLGIHQYFLKAKIIYASRMLKEGKSVSEIAAKLSFSSPNYFSTVFKRETGITPLCYKSRN